MKRLLNRITYIILGFFIAISLFIATNDQRPIEVKHIEKELSVRFIDNTLCYFSDGLIKQREGEFHYILEMSSQDKSSMISSLLLRNDWRKCSEKNILLQNIDISYGKFSTMLLECLSTANAEGYYYLKPYATIDLSQKYTSYIFAYFDVINNQLFYAEVI